MEETVGSRPCVKKRKNDWLSTLLLSEFFGSCIPHQELGKNEKNAFCIDCNLGFCRHCATPHALHRRLQICRYAYHDVVRLHDIQRFLDCSKIQTYKINGEKAIHLNPRPQTKDTKGTKKSKIGGSTCEACGRCLSDDMNSFCSIACKVSMNTEDHSQSLIAASTPRHDQASWKEKHSTETNTSEVESSISVAESAQETKPGIGSSLGRIKQSHKRKKGSPLRAPLG